MFHTTLVARLVLFATRVADSMRCDCWSKMSIFTTQCPLCRKVFKTFYSLKKHVRERHDGVDEESLITGDYDHKPPRSRQCKNVLFGSNCHVRHLATNMKSHNYNHPNFLAHTITNV